MLFRSVLAVIQKRSCLGVCSALKTVVRHLSEQQASTALRPFYFEVHPDLFGQYPQQRAVNEDSLKKLNGYLEGLHSHKKVTPVQLEFYVRDRIHNEGQWSYKERRMMLTQVALYAGVSEEPFQKVVIDLRSNSLRETVEKVLLSCNLSLDYVNSVEPKEQQLLYRPVKWDPTFYHFYNIPNPYDVPRKKPPRQTLSSWLKVNIAIAKENQAHIDPIRSQTELLCKDLIEELGVLDVRWEHGWGYRQFRACLAGFNRLYEHNKDHICLHGRSLVFSTDTGMSLEGDVLLRVNDVSESWLPLLKSVKSQVELLEKLPCLEQKLSQLLNNVTVVRQKRHELLTARDYILQLSKLISQLKPYLVQPKNTKLRQDLSGVSLVVDCATGPLSISSDGHVVVPSSSPVFLIIEFLNENAEKAVSIANQSKRIKAKEKQLTKQCLEELELLSLTKDKNVTSVQMQVCCEHLLEDPINNIGVSLKGCRLKVSLFHSVMSDGEICIPWNWKSKF